MLVVFVEKQGRGETSNMWIFILGLIILVFTACFSFLLAGANIEELKAQWPNRRCDLDAMLLASFLKPKDNPQSAFEYSYSNFQFCMENNAESILRKAFGPLFAIVQTFMGALSTITDIMNKVRAQFAGLVQKYNALLQARYTQYKQIQYQAAKGWHMLGSAMNRMSAVLTGFLWIGVSAIIGLLNLKDYVVKVVLIIIGILMAMVIILFLFMAPVIPVIIITIGVLAGAGIAMGGAAGVFCVEPRALIKMADGTLKYNHDISVGDLLESKNGKPNIVTGLLYADGKDHGIVEIQGICMSKGHRVLHNGVMILAGEHPEAKSSKKTFDRLICLNTTTHEVPIASGDQTLWVGDWQEIDLEDDHYWMDAIDKILNSETPFLSGKYPHHPPQIDPKCQMKHAQKGWVDACHINIGDMVLDAGGVWTPVLAKYLGTYYGGAVSDGVWYQHNSQWRLGYQPPQIPTLHYGVFFVTASGTFVVKTPTGDITVRDFTECGVDRIDSTYTMLDSILLKKTVPTL